MNEGNEGNEGTKERTEDRTHERPHPRKSGAVVEGQHVDASLPRERSLPLPPPRAHLHEGRVLSNLVQRVVGPRRAVVDRKVELFEKARL